MSECVECGAEDRVIKRDVGRFETLLCPQCADVRRAIRPAQTLATEPPRRV